MKYQLILHDFGNLAMQVIIESDDQTMLESAADNLNFLFQSSGRQEQFDAEVYETPVDTEYAGPDEDDAYSDNDGDSKNGYSRSYVDSLNNGF